MPVLQPRMTFKAMAPKTHLKQSVAVTQHQLQQCSLPGWAVTDSRGSFLCLYFLQLTFSPYKQETDSSTSQATSFEALLMGWMTPS